MNIMSSNKEGFINIALIGCGWWSQGWHLPHLSNNIDDGKKIRITVLLDTSDAPRSTLNPSLETLEELRERYNDKCIVLDCVEKLLDEENNDGIIHDIDGVIVCTPHSTHAQIAHQLLSYIKNKNPKRKRKLHIFMEKPMTTDVKQAISLHNEVLDSSSLLGSFILNHSANYRIQTRKAREIIASSIIGKIKYINASFNVPLKWLFDDPKNKGWVYPQEGSEMKGNGYAWGQSTHIFAWIYHVIDSQGIAPKNVYCKMNYSDVTGADVCNSATVTLSDDSNKGNSDNGNILLNFSGTTLLPGNAHSSVRVGKQVSISIFGTEGSLLYSGDDILPHSGKLEISLNKNDGKIQNVFSDEEIGFDFENLDENGTGKSLVIQL